LSSRSLQSGWVTGVYTHSHDYGVQWGTGCTVSQEEGEHHVLGVKVSILLVSYDRTKSLPIKLQVWPTWLVSLLYIVKYFNVTVVLWKTFSWEEMCYLLNNHLLWTYYSLSRILGSGHRQLEEKANIFLLWVLNSTEIEMIINKKMPVCWTVVNVQNNS
jgi:hypothetical protein